MPRSNLDEIIEKSYPQEIKIACMVCCPMCDEKKCCGRYECREIKRYIENSEQKGDKQ